MAEPNFNDWNRQIIKEFRANGGQVGGQFEGVTLLLLTTTGAKRGQKRINPLTYLLDGERVFIFAAKGGSPTHPDWYHNLVAHPQVSIELGTEQFEATAVLVEGEERDQISAKEVQRHPGAADYEKKTTRKIPVVELVYHKSSYEGCKPKSPLFSQGYFSGGSSSLVKKEGAKLFGGLPSDPGAHLREQAIDALLQA